MNSSDIEMLQSTAIAFQEKKQAQQELIQEVERLAKVPELSQHLSKLQALAQKLAA